jgi:5-methyltetrahydrofolate--homocysteine methyltransferase
MMGLSPQAFAAFTHGFASLPLAVGSNCGVGASDLVLSVLGITEGGAPIPVIAKANAGIPRIDGDRVVYTATPETMEVYTHLAIDAGARIVGGCCGTSPAHLAAMRRAVDAHQAGGPRPDIARLIALLGPLAQPPAAAGERRTGRRARA